MRSEEGLYLIADKQTRENLNIIAKKTNAFLAEPMTLEQCEVLIGSIIDFYFFHSDNVSEFEDFISYIASFMELLADNIVRGNEYER